MTLKRERLQSVGLSVPENVKFVPVDLIDDTIEHSLRKAGFNTPDRAFFSWLGSSEYLDQETVVEMA